jgi:uncharacterized UPF0160 family protein
MLDIVHNKNGGSESGSDRYEIPISFAGAIFIFYVTNIYHPRQIVKKRKSYNRIYQNFPIHQKSLERESAAAS